MKKFLFIGLVMSLVIALAGCQQQSNPYKEVLDIMNQTLQKMMEINQKLMEALIAKQNTPSPNTSTSTAVSTQTTTLTATDTGTTTATSTSAAVSDPVDTSTETSVTPDAVSSGSLPGQTIRNYQFNGTDGDGKPFSGTVVETEKDEVPGQ